MGDVNSGSGTGGQAGVGTRAESNRRREALLQALGAFGIYLTLAFLFFGPASWSAYPRAIGL